MLYSEEHKVLGEDVRTVDMVDMNIADMKDMDMVDMGMVDMVDMDKQGLGPKGSSVDSILSFFFANRLFHSPTRGMCTNRFRFF